MNLTKYLGASAVAVMCLAVASPGLAQSDISGTLTGVYDSSYKPMFDAIIAKFNERYPNVKIEMTYQGGGDIGALITTQLMGGTAPDILVNYPGGTPGGAVGANAVSNGTAGLLLDFSDAEWAQKIPDAWLGLMGNEGEVYAYPGAVQPLAAIYNKDTLDKLGLAVPQTLDEVLKLCSDAKAAGLIAYAQGLGEVQHGPQMLSFAQTATLVYGPDPNFDQKRFEGKATFQESGWVRQFEVYQEMYSAGCFGEGALGITRQQGAEAVATGLALAQVDVGGQMGIMKGIAPDANFLVAAIPATNDGKSFVTALPAYVVVANAATKNPEAAKAFMAFLAESEASVLYANAFSAVPIIPNEAYTAPADLKEFAALVAAGNYAQLANFGVGQVQTALNEGVQSMLLGNDTPASVAEKMQAAYEAGL